MMSAKQFPFTRRNWAIFVLGIAVIAFGYFLLSVPPADGFWSLTAAPLLLVTGYCVLLPIAILYEDPEADGSVSADRPS